MESAVNLLRTALDIIGDGFTIPSNGTFVCRECQQTRRKGTHAPKCLIELWRRDTTTFILKNSMGKS